MGKYGYERLSSDLAPSAGCRITAQAQLRPNAGCPDYRIRKKIRIVSELVLKQYWRFTGISFNNYIAVTMLTMLYNAEIQCTIQYNADNAESCGAMLNRAVHSLWSIGS